jgi:hypothetical protein
LKSFIKILGEVGTFLDLYQINGRDFLYFMRGNGLSRDD